MTTNTDRRHWRGKQELLDVYASFEAEWAARIATTPLPDGFDPYDESDPGHAIYWHGNAEGLRDGMRTAIANLREAAEFEGQDGLTIDARPAGLR